MRSVGSKSVLSTRLSKAYCLLDPADWAVAPMCADVHASHRRPTRRGRDARCEWSTMRRDSLLRVIPAMIGLATALPSTRGRRGGRRRSAETDRLDIGLPNAAEELARSEAPVLGD